MRHLVDTVTGLAERGIGFRSLQESIDTTTPGGKLIFHLFAALAEFERDMIRDRQDPWREARLDLPPPQQGRQSTGSPGP